MLWATFAYVATLLVVVPVAGGLVLLLAGPHGGLAPHWMARAVLALGWLAVLALPAGCAAWAWRRCMRQPRAAGRHSADNRR